MAWKHILQISRRVAYVSITVVEFELCSVITMFSNHFVLRASAIGLGMVITSSSAGRQKDDDNAGIPRHLFSIFILNIYLTQLRRRSVISVKLFRTVEREVYRIKQSQTSYNC